MKSWTMCACVAIAAAALAPASASGATFPVDPRAPALAATPTLTVQLPAGWLASGSFGAKDPVHTTVQWAHYVRLEPLGTTLDALRAADLAPIAGRPRIHGWIDLWGWKAGRSRTLGDTFVDLPAGRAWRLTQLVVAGTEAAGWAKRTYVREYVFDRGPARDPKTGAQKELFSLVYTYCGWTPLPVTTNECGTHNAQLAKLMRSLRFMS